MKVIIKGIKDDTLGTDLSLKEIFELKQKYEENRSVVKTNNTQGKKEERRTCFLFLTFI